jgi:RecA-family ATPase
MSDFDEEVDVGALALSRLRGLGHSPIKQPHAPPVYEPLTVIDPTSLFGIPVPERRWLVHGWLPVGHTTIDYGDGGVGKTLLAQQLLTSCAAGVPWCGLAVEQCRVFGMFCEDDPDELHRRQDAINGFHGLNFGDLNAARWVSGVGSDNVLADFDYEGNMQLTERYHDIMREAKAFRARLVILDTAADLFGGNENDRKQVRRFIGQALNSIAREIDGAVLLNAHPSRTGMAAGGSGDGGSTAWSNTARSRWSLTRPDESDSGDVDPHERILTKRKSNYSSVGDTIRLRWQDGVLAAPDAVTSRFTRASRRDECEALFMTMLDRSDAQGRQLSHSRNAGNFAPLVFSKAPDRQDFKKRDFEAAMEALFASKVIEVRSYGKPSDNTRKIARVIVPNGVSDDGATVGDGPEKSQ